MKFIAGCFFLIFIILFGSAYLNGIFTSDNGKLKDDLAVTNQVNHNLETNINQQKIDLENAQRKLEELKAADQKTIFDQQNTIDNLQKQVSDLQNQASTNQADLKNLTLQLQQAQLDLGVRQGGLNILSAKYDDNQKLLQALSVQLDLAIKTNKTIAEDNGQKAKQIEALQNKLALVTNLQQNAGIPAAALSGGALMGLFFLGVKKMKIPALHVSQPQPGSRRPQTQKQIKVVMSEHNYQAFQDYLKTK